MKLIIYTNQKFSADFTVVSSDGFTGEVLEPEDTATFKLVTKGPNSKCVIDNVPLTIVDINNGVFNLTLTPEQTASLSSKPGFEEDKFIPMDNYVGYLEFNLSTGNRQATVDIAVEEIPTCQIPV